MNSEKIRQVWDLRTTVLTTYIRDKKILQNEIYSSETSERIRKSSIHGYQNAKNLFQVIVNDERTPAKIPACNGYLFVFAYIFVTSLSAAILVFYGQYARLARRSHCIGYYSIDKLLLENCKGTNTFLAGFPKENFPLDFIWLEQWVMGGGMPNFSSHDLLISKIPISQFAASLFISVWGGGVRESRFCTLKMNNRTAERPMQMKFMENM